MEEIGKGLMAAAIWFGKFILIMLGLLFILLFIMMIIYVLKNDTEPRPLSDAEAMEQARAIEEANRKREEKRNARKVRRELQCGQVPQGSDGKEKSQ